MVARGRCSRGIAKRIRNVLLSYLLHAASTATRSRACRLVAIDPPTPRELHARRSVSVAPRGLFCFPRLPPSHFGAAEKLGAACPPSLPPPSPPRERDLATRPGQCRVVPPQRKVPMIRGTCFLPRRRFSVFEISRGNLLRVSSMGERGRERDSDASCGIAK